MEKINWGFISTAKIGLEKVGPALKKSRLGQFEAIASRSMSNARKAAEALNVPRIYGSYEDLLADKSIQAVYIPLPNHLHAEWTHKALLAGKHVLCEKPLTPDLEQTKAFVNMTAQFPALKVMEAFMYRFHPQWEKAKNWISQGKIGELRTIHSDFCYFNTDPENIRNIRDFGGGGLLDIGCYCISVARFIFEKEPVRVSGTIDFDPVFKTDRLASGILDFQGATATFTCSTQLPNRQSLFIHGTEATIEIPMPFNPAPELNAQINLIVNGNIVDKTFALADQYTLECDSFSKSIIDDSPVATPLTDALNNAAIIDAIFRSSETGKWITL
ncbi:MAG: Gfo/Idh/MocA family oxidoreductase [Spirochaetales bacterium]|nr:Gfo/Idh/MocA family oxidoreductase [Spirochaetales bacterium]